jgi:hypothetical protein
MGITKAELGPHLKIFFTYSASNFPERVSVQIIFPILARKRHEQCRGFGQVAGLSDIRA